MRLLPLLLAASVLAGPCAAAIPVVVEIGQNSAAAGSNTIVITTNKPCGIGGEPVVFAAEFGATTIIVTPADSAGNTYSAISATTGTLVFTRAWRVQTRNNLGLPSGGTITFTFPNTTTAQAVKALCVFGLNWLNNNDGNGGAGTTGTSSTIAITPPATTAANDLQIVWSAEVSGAADTWTESAGYTALTPVLSVNALRVAYQIVPATAPTAYSATSTGTRVWVANASAIISQVCEQSAAGAGPC